MIAEIGSGLLRQAPGRACHDIPKKGRADPGTGQLVLF